MGSQLLMNSRQKTFAVALSRQMAPASHILAYCIVEGEVVMDSMSFFVRDTTLMQVRPWHLISLSKSNCEWYLILIKFLFPCSCSLTLGSAVVVFSLTFSSITAKISLRTRLKSLHEGLPVATS